MNPIHISPFTMPRSASPGTGPTSGGTRIRVGGSVDVEDRGVERCRGADEQAIPLRAPERQVRADLRRPEPPDERAIGVEAVEGRARCDPDVPGGVEADAIDLAELDDGEDPVTRRPALDEVEGTDMTSPGVGDVKEPFVERESEPVGSVEVVGDLFADTGARVGAVQMAAVELRIGADAFVVGRDPVGRIGEPDRSIRPFDNVVGTVEPPARERLGDDRGAPVMVGSDDAATPLFTREDTSSAVERLSVPVAARLLERAHRPGCLVPSQRSIV